MAVRFCPQLFKLQATLQKPGAADTQQQQQGQGDQGCDDPADNQENTAGQQPFQLPYRMVFAIATLDSVIIYDTQVSLNPLGTCHCPSCVTLYLWLLACQAHGQELMHSTVPSFTSHSCNASCWAAHYSVTIEGLAGSFWAVSAVKINVLGGAESDTTGCARSTAL